MSALGRKITPHDLHREALRRSSGGKRAIAPCGHPGEHEFAGFIRCLHGCDGEAVPEYVAPEKTECFHRNAGKFNGAWGNGTVTVCLDCHKQYDVWSNTWKDPT